MKSNLKFFKKAKTLPVDKFFQNVLFDKKFGYYSSKNPFGKSGDFITAPKISKLFSEIIAIWIVSTWEIYGKPKKINIIELGGGNGEMMLAKNAATVVITARPSGVDNLPQDVNQASAESSISFFLKELYLLCK